MLEFERDSDFKVLDYPDMSREEIRERTMVKVKKMASYLESDTMDEFLQRIAYISILDPGAFTRFGVHVSQFMICTRDMTESLYSGEKQEMASLVVFISTTHDMSSWRCKRYRFSATSTCKTLF